MRRLFGKKAEPVRSVDEQDQMVLDQMRSAGWDMSEHRLIENLLYFSTRDGAEHASAELTSLGYRVEVKPGAQGDDRLAQASRRHVATIEAIRAMRAELTSIAIARSGEYDGWGAWQ
jgi:hypothetical protein